MQGSLRRITVAGLSCYAWLVRTAPFNNLEDVSLEWFTFGNASVFEKPWGVALHPHRRPTCRQSSKR